MVVKLEGCDGGPRYALPGVGKEWGIPCSTLTPRDVLGKDLIQLVRATVDGYTSGFSPKRDQNGKCV